MKKISTKFLSVILTVIFIMSVFSVSISAESGELRFGEDGKFTILQISDTQDDRYLAYELPGFIKKAIELADPDLVVFTGDIVEDSRVGDLTVDSEGWREGVTVKGDYNKTLANTKAATEQIFSIINDKNIPFAIAQGNNDYACGVTNEDWLKIYSSFENCLVRDESPDSDGRIDYSLPIYSSDGKRIAFNIYMTDTERNGVTDEQIEWYENTSKALEKQNGEKVKSFVFQHIPVDDVGNLFEECKPFSENAVLSLGKWYRLGGNASGHFEVLYKPGKTTKQFTSWKNRGDVIGAYFGHIHSDGYTGTWDGIELGLTYGAQFAKNGPYGVRVFTLDENDITNYDNTLYTYSNQKFVPQLNNKSNLNSLLEKIISVIKTILINLFK